MIDSSLGQSTPQDANNTEQWFNSLQTPSPIPPRSGRKKHIIIGLCIFISLALLGTASALLFGKVSACLNANDYKALTGSDTSDIVAATDSFYTNYVLFADNSNNFDDATDSGEHGERLIQKISDFYAASAGKSVIITINGNYFKSESKTIASEHITTVKNSLLAAGVPQAALVVKDPAYIEPEDPPTVTSETILTISSASTCQ